VNCQIDHRRAHKKECRRIKKELLEQEEARQNNQEGKEGQAKGNSRHKEEKFSLWNPMPRPECPICMIVLPINPECGGVYMPCCGKLICPGCMEADAAATAKIAGKNLGCAFCRHPALKNNREVVKLTEKRMELGDASAFYLMAGFFERGERGLPLDTAKAAELVNQAADRGCTRANYSLGQMHLQSKPNFVARGSSKTRRHWELAAKRGHYSARYNLGAMEDSQGNYDLAVKHWRISASYGDTMAIMPLQMYKELGRISEAELEQCKRNADKAIEEMRSEDRDRYIQGFLRNPENQLRYPPSQNREEDIRNFYTGGDRS
jgi:hypothetical protein